MSWNGFDTFALVINFINDASWVLKHIIVGFFLNTQHYRCCFGKSCEAQFTFMHKIIAYMKGVGFNLNTLAFTLDIL